MRAEGKKTTENKMTDLSMIHCGKAHFLSPAPRDLIFSWIQLGHNSEGQFIDLFYMVSNRTNGNEVKNTLFLMCIPHYL